MFAEPPTCIKNSRQNMKAVKSLVEDVYGKQLSQIDPYKDAQEGFKVLTVHISEAHVSTSIKSLTSKNVKSVKTLVQREETNVMKAGGLATDFQCAVAKEMARIKKM